MGEKIERCIPLSKGSNPTAYRSFGTMSAEDVAASAARTPQGFDPLRGVSLRASVPQANSFVKGDRIYHKKLHAEGEIVGEDGDRFIVRFANNKKAVCSLKNLVKL